MRRLWLTQTSDFLEPRLIKNTSEAVVESVFKAAAAAQAIGRENYQDRGSFRPASDFDRKHGENS
jgi:hypothetical protein